jgi:hypothetical protein
MTSANFILTIDVQAHLKATQPDAQANTFKRACKK